MKHVKREFCQQVLFNIITDFLKMKDAEPTQSLVLVLANKAQLRAAPVTKTTPFFILSDIQNFLERVCVF